ncbi:ferredoxin:protochlorophyllide reductase (ATP-dependent) subunit B [soil metagenome]
MQLTIWTYEGPPHVGAMRVATGMTDVHYVLHAPQGDTYADLLFTMIERRDHRPPVTYTTFQAQDLGGDTAGLVKEAVRAAWERFRPQAMLVGASCTAELIQDDPGGLAATLDLPIPVVPLELPAYQRKENWGASETFYQLVRAMALPHAPPPGTERGTVQERCAAEDNRRPTCNLLGATALGFRHRDDVTEVTRLLEALGIEVRLVAPMHSSPNDLAGMGEADFNVVLYPEIGGQAATWLERPFRQPVVRTVPIGIGATRDFVREVARVAGLDEEESLRIVDRKLPSRMPWWSRSVDSTYLTDKRVFIFGDATHAVAAARVAREELGFQVVGLGCYNREFAREVRTAAKAIGIAPLITDDYLEVEDAIREAAPELVLGTQMERHIAKRLGLFCTVISAPVHVQDFPARYSPQMGPEGANVIFDSWVHPLMMGLEEHLLGMFQADFEFANDRGPSHLHAEAPPAAPMVASAPAVATPPVMAADATAVADAAVHPGATPGDSHAAIPAAAMAAAAPPASPESAPTRAPDSASGNGPAWAVEAEQELKKIPFFVRGKVRRNTEAFASERGIPAITVDVMYDAKAHFGNR